VLEAIPVEVELVAALIAEAQTQALVAAAAVAVAGLFRHPAVLQAVMAPAQVEVLGFTVKAPAVLPDHLRKASVGVEAVLVGATEAAGATALVLGAELMAGAMRVGEAALLAPLEMPHGAGLFVLSGRAQVQAVWPVLSHRQIRGICK
jgi:hypothetical protein